MRQLTLINLHFLPDCAERNNPFNFITLIEN